MSCWRLFIINRLFQHLLHICNTFLNLSLIRSASSSSSSIHDWDWGNNSKQASNIESSTESKLAARKTKEKKVKEGALIDFEVKNEATGWKLEDDAWEILKD